MNRSADPSLIAAIFHAVQEADQKAIKQEDEHGFVTFYTFPCGPWHKIIGLVRQLPVSEADLLPYLSPPPDQPLRAMEDPRAAAVPQWIACADREPGEDGRYLIAYRVFSRKHVRLFIGDYYVNNGWSAVGDKCEIIAWMPLPAPPKETT